jgi:hypothetical protein
LPPADASLYTAASFGANKWKGYNMKRLILVTFGILTILLSGCATHRFDVKLASVVEGTAADKQPIEVAEGNQWEDESIVIVWIFTNPALNFVLTNKTKDTMTLPWDNACITGPDSAVHRVFHAGVKIIDRANPQAPSPIPAGSKLNDMFFPTDLVSWGGSMGWVNASLFPIDKTTMPESYQGKTIQALLPLEWGGAKHEYTFLFKVDAIPLNSKQK